jgi:predicted ATPase
LLDAVRFLRDLVLDGGGLAKAVELRGGMAAVRSLHAKQVNDVMVAVEVGNDGSGGWRYELEFNQHAKESSQPRVRREQVWRICTDGSRASKLRRPNDPDRKDPLQLTQTALQQVTQNKDFRELADFFRSVAYLHIVPQLVREEQRPRSDALGPDPYGRDLLDRVANTPKAQQRGRLKQIESILKRVVPQLREIRQEQDSHGRPHLKAKFQHWRGFGAMQNETQFSDGTLRLIGLLWALQEAAEPLLLEEPELSLHTQIVGRLAGFIHRAQTAGGGRQVLVSTHSEHLLGDSGIAPEEILLVTPADEGSQVVCGAEHKQVSRLMRAGILPSEAVIPQTTTRQMELFDFVPA